MRLFIRGEITTSILQWETEVLSHPPTVLIGTVDNFAKIAWENMKLKISSTLILMAMTVPHLI